jgi:hypothetical protein
MSYTPNVPQGNQQIASTQVPILNNFTYINTAMRVNHTWNGNGISTEAAGSHQRLDMPNQGSDIASLPSGIASVLYSIGSNLYAYNGNKNPVSGVSGSGTIAITTTAQPFLTLPVTSGSSPIDTIGFVLFTQGPFINTTTPVFTFFTLAGSTYVGPTIANVSGLGGINLFMGSSANSLTIRRLNSGDYTATFKYIYWPI